MLVTRLHNATRRQMGAPEGRGNAEACEASTTDPLVPGRPAARATFCASSPPTSLLSRRVASRFRAHRPTPELVNEYDFSHNEAHLKATAYE